MKQTMRTCDQCGKRLITHRADARFCDERCRARWNNKHRKSGTATDIRIVPAEGGVGSRGGNIRSAAEARDVQSASKELDRWRLIMEQQVFRTLVSTGYFHVDDLDCLELPPRAFEVRGTLVNRVRAKGWMQRSGADRKVAHKAANARKAPIYRITTKGRQELPGLVGDSSGDGASSQAAAVSGESGLTGSGSGVGALCPTGTASPDKSPLTGVSAGRPSSQGEGKSGGDEKPAGVHSGESIPGGRGQARAAESVSKGEPVDATPGEPARLFDDSPPSAYERLQDVA